MELIMKPYKGIVRISCNRKCDKKLPAPEAGCLNCVHGMVEILDLGGNVLEELDRPVLEGTTLAACGPEPPYEVEEEYPHAV